MSSLIMLFKLLIAHALCDFSLQTPFIASAKNRHNQPKDDALPPGQKPNMIWPYVLSAHALIHAGGVFVVTGDMLCSWVMFVTHLVIDFLKCEPWTGMSIHIDQLLHWVVIVSITAHLTL
jgi:hypothetical protein